VRAMVPPDLITMVVKSRGEIKNRTNFCRSSDHQMGLVDWCLTSLLVDSHHLHT
jgi:hypothetical protein